MSNDLLLGMSIGMVLMFLLDNVVFPRWAHTLADRRRRLLRGR